MKFRPTRIGLDMDGVMFNFARRYAQCYTRVHPDDPVAEEDILKDWNVAKTTKYGDKLWKQPGFFFGMPPYPGWEWLFKWLCENYDVVVMSAAPHHMLAEKTAALKALYPDFDEWNILYGNRKDLVDLDVLIDDAPHNIEAVKDKVLIVDRPYNQHVNYTGLGRVKGAVEIGAWVEAHCISKKGFPQDTGPLADLIEREFPMYSRVVLFEMNSRPDQVPAGTMGTVRCHDKGGVIQVQWDNGCFLPLVAGVDDFDSVEKLGLPDPSELAEKLVCDDVDMGNLCGFCGKDCSGQVSGLTCSMNLTEKLSELMRVKK